MNQRTPTLFRQNLGLFIALILFGQISASAVFFLFAQRPRMEVFTEIAARNIVTVKNTLAALPVDARVIYLQQINQGGALEISTRAPDGVSSEGRGVAKMVMRMLSDDLKGSGVAVSMIGRPERRLVATWQEGTTSYWATFPELPLAAGSASVWIALTIVIGLLSLAGAWLIEKHLHRPLDELVQAVRRVGAGAKPEPLAEDGPREIATLAAGFNRMVSDLGAIEQQRVLMLAGVSHDLRTPLTKMRLALGILEGTIEPGLQQQMERGVEEMDRLVGQFLDFARLESEEPAQPIELRPLILECIEPELAAMAAVNTEELADVELDGRPHMLQRLATNLIDNACKYGRVDAAHPLVIKAHRQGANVELTFRDHGPGFGHDSDHLIRPFVRGSGAMLPGSGLGLAIVARIVAMHQGSLELISRSDGGEVRIVLPERASPRA
jgi:two-component system osmolarity sensor histidine kinase EnvZ